jgi:hypothetical protein
VPWAAALVVLARPGSVVDVAGLAFVVLLAIVLAVEVVL